MSVELFLFCANESHRFPFSKAELTGAGASGRLATAAGR
jgi:hypothetical protein